MNELMTWLREQHQHELEDLKISQIDPRNGVETRLCNARVGVYAKVLDKIHELEKKGVLA